MVQSCGKLRATRRILGSTSVPEEGRHIVQQAGLWQAVLGEIELSVSRGNFMTWFKNTELASVSDDSVVIAVPNIFIKQQLERKYGDLLTEVMKKNGIENATIVYKIASASSSRKNEEEPVLVSSPVPSQKQ